MYLGIKNGDFKARLTTNITKRTKDFTCQRASLMSSKKKSYTVNLYENHKSNSDWTFLLGVSSFNMKILLPN